MSLRRPYEAVVLLLLLPLSGCVSGARYDVTVHETQEAHLQYDAARHRTAELVAENRRLQTRVVELEAAIRHAQQEFERAEREYRATQEEWGRFRRESQKAREDAKECAPARDRLGSSTTRSSPSCSGV